MLVEFYLITVIRTYEIVDSPTRMLLFLVSIMYHRR